jgi:hypothetical protein
MNLEPGSQDLNFSPPAAQPPAGQMPIELLLPTIAEDSIVQTIMEGSGGPDNREITEGGLRFVRYLLATSRSARHGFVPNFKDMETVRVLARQFIRRCGCPSLAIQAMINITGHDAG